MANSFHTELSIYLLIHTNYPITVFAFTLPPPVFTAGLKTQLFHKSDLSWLVSCGLPFIQLSQDGLLLVGFSGLVLLYFLFTDGTSSRPSISYSAHVELPYRIRSRATDRAYRQRIDFVELRTPPLCNA